MPEEIPDLHTVLFFCFLYRMEVIFPKASFFFYRQKSAGCQADFQADFSAAEEAL